MLRLILKLIGAVGCIGLGAGGTYWFVPLPSQTPQSEAPALIAGLMNRPLPTLHVVGEGVGSHPAPLVMRGGAVIVVFRPGCGTCALVAGAWKELAATLPSEAALLELTEGSLQEGRAWLVGHQIAAGSLYQQAEPGSLVSTWGLKGTPLTLVVGEDLKVVFARYGLLSTSDIRRVVSIARNAGRT